MDSKPGGMVDPIVGRKKRAVNSAGAREAAVSQYHSPKNPYGSFVRNSLEHTMNFVACNPVARNDYSGLLIILSKPYTIRPQGRTRKRLKIRSALLSVKKKSSDGFLSRSHI
jgi:hypothetical protein